MKTEKFYRVNNQIKFSPIVLIDESGQNLGSIPLFKARDLAISKNLDLVEVSPNSKPPICKIMDFGKFKYEQDLKEKKQRQSKKQIQIKEVRLSCGIADNDMETKAKLTTKFLEIGQKVQVRLEFRRRENSHREIGYAVINKFLKKIEEIANVAKQPSMDGRFISCLIEPKK
jgi:translation initiation factor IF-3